jgi:hypothetical protein
LPGGSLWWILLILRLPWLAVGLLLAEPRLFPWLLLQGILLPGRPLRRCSLALLVRVRVGLLRLPVARLAVAL